MAHQAKPDRSWQEIIAEAAMAMRESNLERVADLRKELEDVLGGRNKVLSASAASDKSPAPKKTA